MKNISLILNGVLFVLVIILFVLHFNDASSGTKSSSASSAHHLDSLSSRVDSMQANAYRMAMINFDSLISRYDYYRQMEIEMRNRMQSYQQELARKRQQLRQDHKEFMKNGASMSLEEQKQHKRELQQRKKKLQELVRDRQKELQNLQRQVNEKVVRKMSSYMKKYADEHGYDYIMSYRPSLGNFVFGRDSTKVNEVTNDVISGLNKNLNSPSGQ